MLGRIGRKRIHSTLDRAIGGGAGLDGSPQQDQRLAADVQKSGLDKAMAIRLVRRYGSAAPSVAAMFADGGNRMLGNGSAYCEGEIHWILAEERVSRLADIVLRRTLLPFENAVTAEILDDIATLAAKALGWDEVRRQSEIAHTADLLVRRYKVKSLAADSTS